MRFNPKYRNTEPEWMDDPQLDHKILDIAVADINKCNRILRGLPFTRDAVREIIARQPHKKWRITDLGCSDGTMLRYLKDQLPDYDLDLVGIDLSIRSIENAREKSKGYEGIRFRESDIFQTSIEELECDILLVTLTLHHFQEKEIISYLERFQQMTKVAIIVNDLHRSPIAYGFFKIFSPIFIGNEISIHDGLISIASGFRRADFKRYAKILGVKNDRLKWKWSFRYIWILPIDERKD